jgi:hypothetical protein
MFFLILSQAQVIWCININIRFEKQKLIIPEDRFDISHEKEIEENRGYNSRILLIQILTQCGMRVIIKTDHKEIATMKAP